MAGLKAFIGYDLGDGETITDMVVLDIDKQKHRGKSKGDHAVSGVR